MYTDIGIHANLQIQFKAFLFFVVLRIHANVAQNYILGDQAWCQQYAAKQRPHADTRIGRTPPSIIDHIRALLVERPVHVHQLVALAIVNILPRTSIKIAVDEDGRGCASMSATREPWINMRAVYRGEPWGRGPAIVQLGPVSAAGAETDLFAHSSARGVYTTRHFRCALGYPRQLRNQAYDSQCMMVGELAAADCPRAVRLVLQYDTSGNPIHTGMRKPHPQLVYQPHQLTLTHVIVVGAHWVPAAQEATMREASRVRDLEFRSRNRREDDLTIRLENAPLRGGPGRAADRNSIDIMARLLRSIGRSRTLEAIRTHGALRCLAFVDWEGDNTDGTARSRWPLDSDTCRMAMVYRSDRTRAQQLAATLAATDTIALNQEIGTPRGPAWYPWMSLVVSLEAAAQRDIELNTASAAAATHGQREDAREAPCPPRKKVRLHGKKAAHLFIRPDLN
jgi:hypothetical protein